MGMAVFQGNYLQKQMVGQIQPMGHSVQIPGLGQCTTNRITACLPQYIVENHMCQCTLHSGVLYLPVCPVAGLCTQSCPGWVPGPVAVPHVHGLAQ